MTDRVDHYFTFGQTHMSSYPLPKAGRLADFWVRVSLPRGYEYHHRDVFIRNFMEYFCPHPTQFAFEYSGDIKSEHFPGGELCLITEEGIQDA